MTYSLSSSPSGTELLFISILILPCPKGTPLSVDPNFLACLPSSTSMSRFGHVHTRNLIVLRPRIWMVVQWWWDAMYLNWILQSFVSEMETPNNTEFHPWPCHSKVNIIADSLLLRPPAQLPRSMKRYGITNSEHPGWKPGRGVTTLWRFDTVKEQVFRSLYPPSSLAFMQPSFQQSSLK